MVLELYVEKEKKQLGIIEKLSKGITLDKILPYKISSMKVYAFVGPSRNRKKLQGTKNCI